MTGQLLAGTGRADITAPIGTPMGGYGARVEGAQGVHDPLWAKALVLRTEDVGLAIVSCDLLGLTADVLDPVRDQVEQECGIPRDHVMVVCTHTHSGPDSLRLFLSGPSPEYFAAVQQGICAAVLAASEGLTPAQAGWGRGRVEGVSANRRKFEAGPLDTDVGVLRVETSSGDPLAVLVHFACHPVALGGNNLLFSADFPGYAMALLEQVDPGCQAMFVNGAFGNVNTGHRADLRVGDRGERTFARARKLGHMLAGEVLKVHNAIDCVPEVDLAARTQCIQLPTRELPDADWATLAATVAERDRVLASAEASREQKVRAQSSALYDRELLLLRESHVAELETEVMAARIGSGVLAGVPAEYFIEYQIALKEQAPHPFTFLTALVNDWVGYVPTPDALDEGGYETKLCRWSKLAPPCGDRIYEALLELARAV